jgi:hypothetical protein
MIKSVNFHTRFTELQTGIGLCLGQSEGLFIGLVQLRAQGIPVELKQQMLHAPQAISLGIQQTRRCCSRLFVVSLQTGGLEGHLG